MVLLHCFWNDVGTLDLLYDLMDKDEDGNAVRGKAVTLGCTGSMFFGKKRLITGLGLKDIMVVETDDVLLVANKEQTYRVNELINKLREEKYPQADTSTTIYTSWGYYVILAEERNYKIIKLVIDPGADIKREMHYNRSEHWTVVEGSAMIMVNNDEKILRKNQSFYASPSVAHKLANLGCVPLEIIEVRTGEYLEDDDVVLLEEGRVW
jgi:mannose-1-phosphate guanylyltransferase/mannose-6-phosphate isomerase